MPSTQFLTAHHEPSAHSSDIYSSIFTSTYLITASGDSTIKFWDASNPEHTLVNTIKTPHAAGIHHLAVNTEGNRMVSVGFAGEVIVWDLEEMKEIGRIEEPGSKDTPWSIVLSPDSKTLATTSYAGKMTIYDLATSSRLASDDTRGSFGTCISYSPDGRYIATGHQNGGLYIFSTETGRMLHSLPGHGSNTVRGVKFSPGSSLLASVGDSETICLHDPRSGEQVASLTGHNRWVFALDWNRTGEYIASAAVDGKVKVWDVRTRECVCTVSDNEGPVWNVSWSKTGIEGFVTVGAVGDVRWYRAAASE
ncbi:Ski complex subunit Rec14 [Saitoella coloradoensis]